MLSEVVEEVSDRTRYDRPQLCLSLDLGAVDVEPALLSVEYSRAQTGEVDLRNTLQALRQRIDWYFGGAVFNMSAPVIASRPV